MESRPKRQTAIDKDYRERKRMRKDKEPLSTDQEVHTDKERVQSDCHQLYSYIKESRDPDDNDHQLCQFFIQLPSKRQYPDYYQVIKHPIALSKIKTKIDQLEYGTVAELKSDIELMVSNAKKYNIKESQVYQDATKLQKLARSWNPGKDRHGSSASSSENKGKAVLKLPGGAFNHGNPRATDDQQRQQLQGESKVKAIRLKAVDKQSKKAVMNELMEAIATKNTKGALALIEGDANLNLNQLKEVEMFGDKFSWAPLHSACYHGQMKVVQALLEHGADIEIHDTWYSATPLGWAAFGDNEKVARFLIEKHGANRGARNIHGQVPYDLVTDKDDPRWAGILKPPYTIKVRSGAQKSDSVDISSDQTEPAGQNRVEGSSEHDFAHAQKKRRGRPPKADKEALEERIPPTERVDLNDFDPVLYMKELFHTIRVHTDNAGRLYSEIFEHLPDRKEYPDYYSVIGEPRSLSMIEDKMKNRRYDTLHDWFKDMKHVFDNAMEYNEPGSRVHRDAKLLLRLLNRMKERLLSREGIPLAQEHDILEMSLSDRPYEVEDKRRAKRVSIKSRPSLPEESTPGPESTPSSVDVVQNAASQPYPMMNMPAIANMVPAATAIPTFAPHAFSIVDTVMPEAPRPDPHALEDLHAVIQASEQNGHLPNASRGFSEVFDGDMRNMRPLDKVTVRSMNGPYAMTLNGDTIGHSLTVPQDTETLKISPTLRPSLQHEKQRISVTVIQDNAKLDMAEGNFGSNDDARCWMSMPLQRGLNTIKITVTANVSRPNSSGVVIPEYRTQVYILFVIQAY